MEQAVKGPPAAAILALHVQEAVDEGLKVGLDEPCRIRKVLPAPRATGRPYSAENRCRGLR